MVKIEKILENLEHIKLNGNNEKWNIDECAICLEKLNENMNILRIPTCKHIFHPACLKDWLVTNYKSPEQKCPFCNQILKIKELSSACREIPEISSNMLYGEHTTRNRNNIAAATSVPVAVDQN